MSDFEQELRRALERDVAGVEPSRDALGTIRERIAARRAWWPSRRRAVAAGRRRGGGLMFVFRTGVGAAVAASLVLFVSGVSSCRPTPTVAPGPVAGPASPSTAPPSGPSSAATAHPSVYNLPVYYVTPGVKGAASAPVVPSRLVREYHRLPVGGASVAAQTTAALAEMVRPGSAYDPDYGVAWPAGTTVTAVAISGSTVNVTLTEPGGLKCVAVNCGASTLGIQEVVWTATAVSGASAVTIRINGGPAIGPVGRAAADGTLLPVWVIDPQTGAVTGTGVTVRLAGIAFEAAINLRILDSTGKAVFTKSVTLNASAPKQGTATLTVSLAPGSYTVQARLLPMKPDGPVYTDDHQFTVH